MQKVNFVTSFEKSLNHGFNPGSLCKTKNQITDLGLRL